MSRAPSILSGGIEIECLMLTDIRSETPPAPTNKDSEEYVTYKHAHIRMARNKVYAALNTPMRVVCGDCNESHDYRIPLNTVPLDSVIQGDQDYSRWTVYMEDIEMSSVEEEKFHGTLLDIRVVGVEIISRVLDLESRITTSASTSDPKHTHWITYRDEVKAVYSKLDENFNNPNGSAASTSRLVVNRACSTHVHIGYLNDSIPLNIIKKVMSVLAAHEIQFDSIHATDRIDWTDRLSKNLSWVAMQDTRNYSARANTTAEGEVFNSSLSQDFIKNAMDTYRGETLYMRRNNGASVGTYPSKFFAQNTPLKVAAQKCDIKSWLELIDGATSVQELCDLLNNRSSTVNLKNLVVKKQDGSDGTGTIEFRQYAGTLQSGEVLAWIEVLLRLFNYANDTSADEVQSMCLQHWRNPNCTILDLLQSLGFASGDETFMHYQHVLGLVPGIEPYSARVFCTEFDSIGEFDSDDLFAPIMKYLAIRRRDTNRPESVEALIDRKFAAGGYGQFEMPYLARRPGTLPDGKLCTNNQPQWSDYQSDDDSA